jgi:hypothetical protein
MGKHTLTIKIVPWIWHNHIKSAKMIHVSSNLSNALLNCLIIPCLRWKLHLLFSLMSEEMSHDLNCLGVHFCLFPSFPFHFTSIIYQSLHQAKNPSSYIWKPYFISPQSFLTSQWLTSEVSTSYNIFPLSRLLTSCTKLQFYLLLQVVWYQLFLTSQWLKSKFYLLLHLSLYCDQMMVSESIRRNYADSVCCEGKVL